MTVGKATTVGKTITVGKENDCGRLGPRAPWLPRVRGSCQKFAGLGSPSIWRNLWPPVSLWEISSLSRARNTEGPRITVFTGEASTSEWPAFSNIATFSPQAQWICFQQTIFLRQIFSRQLWYWQGRPCRALTRVMPSGAHSTSTRQTRRSSSLAVACSH